MWRRGYAGGVSRGERADEENAGEQHHDCASHGASYGRSICPQSAPVGRPVSNRPGLDYTGAVFLPEPRSVLVNSGDFFDYVPLAPAQRRLTTAIDMIIGVGATVVTVAAVTGQPVLYSASSPVMSPFTALSLLIMVAVRQARVHLETWPMVLTLAMTGLVLGGNVASMLMLAVSPRRSGRASRIWCSLNDDVHGLDPVLLVRHGDGAA